jgi:vacuolar protein sorting-associated protein 35
VNIKQIVISLIDRLAAYAAREAESEDPEETKRQEETAARRLAEKVKIQKAKLRANPPTAGSDGVQATDVDVWVSEPQSPTSPQVKDIENLTQVAQSVSGESSNVGNGKTPVRKFRGIPESVKLFEVFWQQIVELIKVRVRSCACVSL